jgi:hypothetical protein
MRTSAIEWGPQDTFTRAYRFRHRKTHKTISRREFIACCLQENPDSLWEQIRIARDAMDAIIKYQSDTGNDPRLDPTTAIAQTAMDRMDKARREYDPWP